MKNGISPLGRPEWFVSAQAARAGTNDWSNVDSQNVRR